MITGSVLFIHSSRFNEAGSVRSRKLCAAVRQPLDVARFNEAGSVRSRKHAADAQLRVHPIHASMRPAL